MDKALIWGPIPIKGKETFIRKNNIYKIGLHVKTRIFHTFRVHNSICDVEW
jgi:hypothetical protein